MSCLLGLTAVGFLATNRTYYPPVAAVRGVQLDEWEWLVSWVMWTAPETMSLERVVEKKDPTPW